MQNIKLIAEFMQLYTTELHGDVVWFDYDGAKPVLYNSDWNWLMEVVDKIEGMEYWTELIGEENNYHFNIGKTGRFFADFDNEGETKIKAVYSGVIQFIEWYNNQNRA